MSGAVPSRHSTEVAGRVSGAGTGWSLIQAATAGTTSATTAAAAARTHRSQPRLRGRVAGSGPAGRFRPKVAVMENVPGMLSHNGRNVAELIAETMDSIDYKTTWAVLNAMDYGVPQVRK